MSSTSVIERCQPILGERRWETCFGGLGLGVREAFFLGSLSHPERWESEPWPPDRVWS